MMCSFSKTCFYNSLRRCPDHFRILLTRFDLQPYSLGQILQYGPGVPGARIWTLRRIFIYTAPLRLLLVVCFAYRCIVLLWCYHRCHCDHVGPTVTRLCATPNFAIWVWLLTYRSFLDCACHSNLWCRFPGLQWDQFDAILIRNASNVTFLNHGY